MTTNIKNFIELVSIYNSKYIIPIRDIQCVYTADNNSQEVEIHLNNGDMIPVKTPYDDIVKILFNDN
jgi:hypothetical protein